MPNRTDRRGRPSCPGTIPSSSSVACEVFGLDRPELGVAAGTGSSSARSRATRRPRRFTLETEHGLDALARGRHRDRARVPTRSRPVAGVPRGTARRVRARRAPGRRSAAARSRSRPRACSTAGASTTHWMYAARLAARIPEIECSPTSCTSTTARCSPRPAPSAAIDLSLHIVRTDYGSRDRERRRAAHGRAAAPRRRPGAVPRPTGARRERGRHARPDARLDRRPPRRAADRRADGRARVDEHADVHAPLPRRHRARRRCAGCRSSASRTRGNCSRPPTFRSTASRRPRGFGTAANLRVHFQRTVGTAPTSYRRAFQTRAFTVRQGSRQQHVRVEDAVRGRARP